MEESIKYVLLSFLKYKRCKCAYYTGWIAHYVTKEKCKNDYFMPLGSLRIKNPAGAVTLHLISVNPYTSLNFHNINLKYFLCYEY